MSIIVPIHGTSWKRNSAIFRRRVLSEVALVSGLRSRSVRCLLQDVFTVTLADDDKVAFSRTRTEAMLCLATPV